MSQAQIVRRKEAARRVGVSLRTLDRWEAASNFPKRVQLGPRAVGYSEAAVEQWLAGRLQQQSER